MREQARLRIVIVNGSVRPGNYTAKASALVADELGKDPDVAVETIDPSALELPPPVSIANVQKAFAADGACQDPAVEKLVRRVGTGLLDYLRNNVCPRIQLEQLLREGTA